MDKKVYDASFSDIVNNLGKRVSRNDDLALIEFDDYDYQKIKEWLTKNQILGNIEYLRNKNQSQFCCLLEGSISLEVNRQRYDLQAGENAVRVAGSRLFQRLGQLLLQFSVGHRASSPSR